MMPTDQPNQGDAQPRRRRPRYRGTHPRTYDEKYKEHDIAAHPDLEVRLRNKGQTPASTHIPILTEEVMQALSPSPGEVVADCTIGYGGHAREFMKRIGPTGKLIGFDVDQDELERTRKRLAQESTPASFHRSNFAGIAGALGPEQLEGYDIIFADLGVSSMQIDNPARGISYRREGPLDMRLDSRLQQTAADLLATLSKEKLADALRQFADEPDCEEIAAYIVDRRVEDPIRLTSQLVELVMEVKGTTPDQWRQQQRRQPTRALHPAARTFQALRILVNDELGALRELLRLAPYCLRPGGRLGIISFHSGEDRLAKRAFRDGVADGTYQHASTDVIVPQTKERTYNPRSASAKFRWAAKA
ncbi:MAG: 16S rRNA (cytosine(1402)-N(4))-methyltransferase RsmH [Gemmatimonadetes bacterium]|nr:16S rRNA (cytosine(1402)-N(4))-methyltransferase RsmH [Gemmatimonadota bacterium]